ncbi:MAG: DegV family protein [Anaerolineales bacterium]|nr:DegV family protein [Anaerolineales bacterium]
MAKVRIVTDSTAHFFDPEFPARHNVTVIPLGIQFGSEAYQDGVDMTTDRFFARVDAGGPIPVAQAPSPKRFAAVYESICSGHEDVLSIHVSSKLSRTIANARAGAEEVLGRCKITIIDSLTTSIGLGLLVEAAALAAERGASEDDIVRIVRGMIPRLYAVFFIETMEFLAKAERIGKAQAVLGAMLGIKPFLTLEDGDIVPMEKVRTRQQAVEKLVEFVVEFANIEHLAILQSASAPSDDSRLLLERLALEFPGRSWPVLAYGPSLATFVGPRAMGVVVFEGEGEPEGPAAYAGRPRDEDARPPRRAKG